MKLTRFVAFVLMVLGVDGTLSRYFQASLSGGKRFFGLRAVSLP